MEKDYVFFWGGEYSNWTTSPFELDGMTFNCVEQWMMYNKAKVFNDTEIMKKVMETSSPREQKALGRQVKNFDADTWNKLAVDIVSRGCEAKFRQNPDLMEVLIADKDKYLVEASPYDTVWGIGMGEDNPDRFDESKWKGTNWLGIALMNARDRILEDSLERV